MTSQEASRRLRNYSSQKPQAVRLTFLMKEACRRERERVAEALRGELPSWMHGCHGPTVEKCARFIRELGDAE